MVSTNKFTTQPPDAELIIRTDDGTTNHSTDTYGWYDVGAGYAMGDLAQTAQVPFRELAAVLDFTDTTQSSGGDNITMSLVLTNAEDGSNPGQGDTGSIAVTVQLDQLVTGDDGFSGRKVFQFTNEWEGTHYRFVGIFVDFASSAAAGWGGYFTNASRIGVL